MATIKMTKKNNEEYLSFLQKFLQINNINSDLTGVPKENIRLSDLINTKYIVLYDNMFANNSLSFKRIIIPKGYSFYQDQDVCIIENEKGEEILDMRCFFGEIINMVKGTVFNQTDFPFSSIYLEDEIHLENATIATIKAHNDGFASGAILNAYYNKSIDGFTNEYGGREEASKIDLSNIENILKRRIYIETKRDDLGIKDNASIYARILSDRLEREEKKETGLRI